MKRRKRKINQKEQNSSGCKIWEKCARKSEEVLRERQQMSGHEEVMRAKREELLDAVKGEMAER